MRVARTRHGAERVLVGGKRLERREAADVGG